MGPFAGRGQGLDGADGKGGRIVTGTWIFWAAAAGMTLAVGWLIGSGLRRGGAGPGAEDLAVYRDQLAEVERDLARGVTGTEEAARIRTEVSRRLLEADRAAGAAPMGAGPKGLALVLVALALAGAFGAYWRLGAPGYPDLGLAQRIEMAEAFRETRPTQAEAEAAQPAWQDPEMDAETAGLIGQLRAAVKARPDDLQGQEFLVQYEAGIGNYRTAAAAQARVVALKGDAAGLEDSLRLADLLIRAAGGYVSPEAEAALTEVLQRDPGNGMARYYSGLMLAQVGRPDLAFSLWEGLLRDSPPGAPWLPPLRAAIGGVAEAAGVEFTLPDAPPGPTADEAAAAQDMAPEDRQAMIEGMVASLGERLATEGGPAEDWARLITSLGVLGRTEEARAIYAEAQGVFAAAPGDLGLLRQAAAAAGVAE